MRLRITASAAYICFAFALFGVTGCSWVPSRLHIFGTPLTRIDRKEKAEAANRDKVYQEAREAAHKTQDALSMAPDSRAVQVAKDFSSETVALLDQAQGPSLLGDLQAWQEQVSKLCSDDLAVRAKADIERSAERLEASRTSEKLAKAESAVKEQEVKVQAYAKDNERIADILRKFVFVVVGIAGFWILGQVLSVASKFVPALSPVSGIVNSVAAPAVQYAYTRAETGLTKVGSAMTEIRKDLPSIAERVTTIFDKHLDEDHKTVVSAGATSAVK